MALPLLNPPIPRALFVRLLVGRLRVLMPLLAVLLRRRRVRFRLIVLALLVVMRRLQVVVRGGSVVHRRLVMALVGGMLARRGHVEPTFRSCGRTPVCPRTGFPAGTCPPRGLA